MQFAYIHTYTFIYIYLQQMACKNSYALPHRPEHIFHHSKCSNFDASHLVSVFTSLIELNVILSQQTKSMKADAFKASKLLRSLKAHNIIMNILKNVQKTDILFIYYYFYIFMVFGGQFVYFKLRSFNYFYFFIYFLLLFSWNLFVRMGSQFHLEKQLLLAEFLCSKRSFNFYEKRPKQKPANLLR